jgi:methyl-accepting chemotaxis protein
MKSKSFKNWSIFAKILSISIFSIIPVTLILLLYVLPNVKELLIDEKKIQTKNAVEIAYSLVTEYQDRINKGEFDLIEGQNRAMKRISKLRYGNGKEYFWINDFAPKIIMHPLRPKMAGQDASVIKDADGNSIYLQIVQICQKDTGGFLVYNQLKPGFKDPQPKVSYVRAYKQWGWIIGTGIYLEDVEIEMAAIKNYFFIAIIAAILLAIGFGYYVSLKISRPIKTLNDAAKKIALGDTDISIDSDTEDEIGSLAGSFEVMVGNIKEQSEMSQKIADGNMDAKIVPKSEKDILSISLINVSDTFKNLVKEVSQLSESAKDGNLSIRGNAGLFKGGYKDIVAGINSTLDAVILPLNMAAEYMDRISKGDIPPKITEQYYGDFNEIKNNLNVCIDSIKLVITDVYSLSAGAVEGRLDARADITKHQGDFRRIVEGVNGTLDAVTEPLKLASTYMNNISKGVIPAKIEKDLKGDFNEIKTSINDLIHSTNLITTGIHRISLSILDGNFNDRGKSQMVVGSWSILIEDINSIMDTLIKYIRFMGKNITDISKGEIPERINEKYKGDYDSIKHDLNICTDTIRALVNDMNALSATAIEGDLKTRADASKHQGDFRKIVEGVNNTLDAVITPLNAAADYIEKIKNGEMSEPITEEFKGDFNGIKNNLNDLIKTVATIFRGMDRIANNMRNGVLTDRGNQKLFLGTWERLIGRINEIIEALVGPIHFMAGNINNISKGEIPEQITDEYHGEFNDVKINLNTCFASINALITDMIMLSDNAVEGRLSQRADASKHLGDYGKIIKGVNDTLDSIVIPINEGVKALEKMSLGDMTIRITSDYKGDHQLIKNSINAVAESLNKALNDVSEAVSATASASNQISSSTEEMAAGASEQTQQAAEVAGAIEQMTKTILDNTKNATNAATNAKDAGQKAKEGGKVVSNTIEGMNRIAKVVKKSSEKVQALGESSDQIGEIAQVIDDIANQTNLLALNAAIEAARAGEQGRGFAVVADEVRKLAERTTKATKEIADTIKKIQKDTADAVLAMDEGAKEVNAGIILTNEAGDSLKEIIASAERVVDNVSQVAAASEEQSSAASEISKSIEAISSVTQESASGTNQIAQAAEDLNRLTLNLEKLVDQFKINDRGSVKKTAIVKHR